MPSIFNTIFSSAESHSVNEKSIISIRFMKRIQISNFKMFLKKEALIANTFQFFAKEGGNWDCGVHFFISWMLGVCRCRPIECMKGSLRDRACRLIKVLVSFIGTVWRAEEKCVVYCPWNRDTSSFPFKSSFQRRPVLSYVSESCIKKFKQGDSPSFCHPLFDYNNKTHVKSVKCLEKNI